MSSQNPTPGGGPLVEGPHDPEHDPRASYGLEPEYVAALTDRLTATSGRTVQVESPLERRARWRTSRSRATTT